MWFLQYAIGVEAIINDPDRKTKPLFVCISFNFFVNTSLKHMNLIKWFLISSYLKEFRVDQCSLFLQHKCSQHRPFSCFHWHFHNQRRRRPVRKRDGTFNYSADNYCSRYDETTGLCPDGDEWVTLVSNYFNSSH